MNENPEVRAWLDELDHPLLDVIEATRKVFLEADDRVTETIKWKSPTFMFEGNIASIDPKAKKHVTVLFHRGAEIPGDHPELEGGGKLARYIRYPDLDSVATGKAGLASIVRDWCNDHA
jgi:hypothetical protein